MTGKSGWWVCARAHGNPIKGSLDDAEVPTAKQTANWHLIFQHSLSRRLSLSLSPSDSDGVPSEMAGTGDDML